MVKKVQKKKSTCIRINNDGKPMVNTINKGIIVHANSNELFSKKL